MSNSYFVRTAFALFAGLAIIPGGTAFAQQGQPAAAPNVAHKVGLIDMAIVFKKYQRFEDLRASLKTEIEKGEEDAKKMATQIQAMQAKMKSVAEGSPEFTQYEGQLAKQSAEFEAFRRAMQRDFLKKESQIYHTVYQDVTAAVTKYAEYYKYTLVIRFSRDDLDPENPSQLMQGMNRQVVYHRADDDITDSVLEYLNKKYTSSAGARPAEKTTVRPTGPRN